MPSSSEALLMNVGKKSKDQLDARGADPQIPQAVDLTLCVSSRESRGLVININIDTFFWFS